MAPKTNSPTRFELAVQSGPASYFTGAITPAKGDKHSLAMDCSNVIGRHPDASICIKDGLVARRHCEIYWDSAGEQFWITDLKSRNGTFVNGENVNPIQSVLLCLGDEIRCGRTLFQLQASQAPGLETSTNET